MKPKTAIIVGALWLARICALLLFLFWGAFFLEHLQEWFLRQDGRLPPPSVWMGQLLHLAILVGLGLLIFRPVWRAALTVIATVLFFSVIGYKGFPYMALLNLPPVMFALVYTAMGKPNKRMQVTGVPPVPDPSRSTRMSSPR
jgi:hypothetical protein